MTDKKELRNFLISMFQGNYQKCYTTLKHRYKIQFNEIFKYSSYLPEKTIFKERLYHIIYNLTEKPQCKLCSRSSIFRGLINGYSLYCNLCYRKDPLFRNKIKQSNIKTYASNKKEIIDKIEQTNLTKYGTKDPNTLPSIKNKIKQTNLQKYGVEYTQQNKEVRKKTEETNLKKLGVKNSFEADGVKEKIKQTNLRKYGVENPLQNINIRKKMMSTLLEKYGVDNISKVETVINQITNINRSNFLERFQTTLAKRNFILVDDIYKNNITNHRWKCLTCNKIFIENWRNMCREYRCPICFPRHLYSIPEQEVADFIKDLGLFIETNNRKIIHPKELDIFIPSKKLAIEFDGLWYHSEEAGCNSSYHLTKTKMCNNQNIRLIHIFEDEWKYKKDIAKSRLKQILNLNYSTRIHARKCNIKEISSKIKNTFLIKYHIQGGDRSSIKLGAFYDNKLISIMTFAYGNISKGSKRKEGVWELNRFCSNSDYHIPGIASKLLSHFQRTYHWNQIFSYADRRWSNGNLYYQLGFQLENITRPNYWYIKNSKRIHRFNLRKRPDEPKNISESKLRSKEGYNKIWDCGSLKFIKNNIIRRI